MAESAFKRTFKIKAFTGDDDDGVSGRCLCSRKDTTHYYSRPNSSSCSQRRQEARSDLVIARDGEAWELIHDMDPANQTGPQHVDGLKNTFEPVEIDDYIDLSNKFKKCKMETEDENPKKWIS
jgi:hypothetical protein